MMKNTHIRPRKYHPYVSGNIDSIPQLKALTNQERLALKAVSSVLPFRVNNYVLEDLIDWNNIPDDPMFQLAFPQEDMLGAKDFNRIYALIKKGANRETRDKAIYDIRMALNPHPAGQMDLNVPYLAGEPERGMQHKYREIVLFFPSQGQTCHTYCTYCFRWAQFVGIEELKFANNEASSLVRYLKKHPEVKDVLFTGGDPMTMRTKILRHYIEPLLKIRTLRSIRIGTKSLAWWPYRFVTDSDADDLLRLFKKVIEAGKNLALMAHYSHPRELSTPVAEEAIRRITSAGVPIRCQAPLIRHVNDSSDVWAQMWQRQVDLGLIPYYMFVERDTGPKQYFEVPLYQALDIFTEAYNKVSGLGRTVRGPSMSCMPGKVLIDGVATVAGKKVFVLKFIQGRDPEWSNRVFFADYDKTATWIDDLKPAFGKKFFFEDQLASIEAGTHPPLWKNQEGRSSLNFRKQARGRSSPSFKIINFQ